MRALVRPRALAVGCVVLAALATPAYAAEAGAGAASLRSARAAWESGSLRGAEPLYRDALEKGGLAPDEVLEGYVRLGAIRSALGKKDQAIAAFRAASILDASFVVPPQAGRKGAAYAAKAKNDTAKIGSIKLTMEAPKESAAGKGFKVKAALDSTHVAIVAKIVMTAKDGTSGKEAKREAATEENVEFDVPSDIALPNASILVRVDAVDSHQNRLGSVEERVKVGDATKDEPPVVAVVPTAAPRASLGATPAPGADTPRRTGGGFWSSPWPYVIGGVALAGAGTAIYFGTRPSQDVSVGQVGVRTR